MEKNMSKNWRICQWSWRS